MVSTYTKNLGIEKPGIGEQDGTWGGTVNADFDMYDEGINGIATITLAAAGSSGSPNTETITNDGTSNAIRHKYITVTDGGDLGADVYVQLAPDTAEKIAYIYNNLNGSRDLYLFQGDWHVDRDYVLAAGKTALVKFSGTGAGASTVTEVMGDMQFNGGLDLGDISITGTTISTTGGTDLNLTPLAGQQLVLDGTVIVDAGVVTGITDLTTDKVTPGEFFMPEAAAPASSVATYGQIWVQTDVPNTLWFTDDTGTDYQLGVGGVDWKSGLETGFFSIGIKDSATEQVIRTTDTVLYVGKSGADFTINTLSASDYGLTIQAGFSSGSGIKFHGSGEAPATSNNIELLSSAGNVMQYDFASTLFDFFGNDLTTSGDITGVIISASQFYGDILPTGAGGPVWNSGAGTPEGAVTAPVGSLWTRTDGGASTTLYVKESGVGNTGWVAK